MDVELQKKWRELLAKLSLQFDGDPDLNAVIFLIGVQELGKGAATYTKDEKIEIMHIAVCSMLEPYGYYEYEGRDEDGWPHYRAIKSLPPMNAVGQAAFMKKAIVEYFERSESEKEEE